MASAPACVGTDHIVLHLVQVLYIACEVPEDASAQGSHKKVPSFKKCVGGQNLVSEGADVSFTCQIKSPLTKVADAKASVS